MRNAQGGGRSFSFALTCRPYHFTAMTTPTDSPTDTPGPADDEHRLENRPRTFKTGKLLYGDCTPIAIDCLVVDISSHGARMETSVLMSVPELLTLRLGDGSERRVRRRWATGNQIGLEFVEDA